MSFKISVVHGTCRAEQAFEARLKWLYFAENPDDLEWILCYDSHIQSEKFIDRMTRQGKVGANFYLWGYKPQVGCVNKVNEAASKATGEILIQASEDVLPPKNWDTLLREVTDWSKEVVLDINEGVEDHTSHDCHHVKGCIMSRARYLKQGYWMHSDFHHLYADDWLSFCAERDGVIVQAKHLIFKHYHYAYGLRKRDEFDGMCKNQLEVKHGKEVYERLKKEYREKGKMF